MKKLLLILPAIGLLSACETQTQTQFAGAATGAAIGAAIAENDSKQDRLTAAAIGGTIGAIAGDYVGRTQSPGQCKYRDSAGNIYIAACPR